MGFIITIVLLIILWILYKFSKKDSEYEYEEDDEDYNYDDYNKKLNSISMDNNGYERDGFGKLIHRKVAFKHLYSYPKYPKRFGSYDVHHKDGNKRNNSPDNLQILTREKHKKKHGIKDDY